MSHFYDHYQQGFYREVYDDLLAMQEQVLDGAVYLDAVQVAKEMMRRVRSNIEILVPRLETLGYRFVDRYLIEMQQKYSQEEQIRINEMFRTFRTPSTNVLSLLNQLEQRVGEFPLSLKAWYEEVGSVNLVGIFSKMKDHKEFMVPLDPLFIIALDVLVEQFANIPAAEEEKTLLPLAPDDGFKYGYSSGGPYTIAVPCRAFDAPFELDHQAPMFIEYLRTCFQWGGFLGLYEARNNERLRQEGRALSSEELAFLTKDLLPF